ncbi:MAG: hypothetical protein GEU93_06545 [Propionibacteriales bacterium]|nr:hypothetical protein [Propionibacteriales bacterium]
MRRLTRGELRSAEPRRAVVTRCVGVARTELERTRWRCRVFGVAAQVEGLGRGAVLAFDDAQQGAVVPQLHAVPAVALDPVTHVAEPLPRRAADQVVLTVGTAAFEHLAGRVVVGTEPAGRRCRWYDEARVVRPGGQRRVTADRVFAAVPLGVVVVRTARDTVVAVLTGQHIGTGRAGHSVGAEQRAVRCGDAVAQVVRPDPPLRDSGVAKPTDPLVQLRRSAGIGFGMGDVTLLDFLNTHGLLPEPRSEVDVAVIPTDDTMLDVAREVATRLRNAGLRSSTPLDVRKLGKEISRADKAGAHHVIIVGPDDWATRHVVVRNLATSDQETVALSDVTAAVN